MDLLLSLVGLGLPGDPPHLCHAQLRPAYEPRRYGAPLLPRSGPDQATWIRPVTGTSFVVTTWDGLLEGADATRARDDLRLGRLVVPAPSAVAPSAETIGEPFALTLVPEPFGRLEVEGAGALWTWGFAVEGAAEALIARLRADLGREDVGRELGLVINALGDDAGMGALFRDTRRIGVVEHLSRVEAGQGGTIISISLDVSPRRDTAATRLLLSRGPNAGTQPLMIRVRASSGESVVAERLVDLPGGTERAVFEAGVHITSVAVSVFDPGGVLLDCVDMSFVQSIGINLAVQGGVDLLPKVFRSAPDAPDLERRARKVNNTVDVSPRGDLRGGLDAMRRNAEAVDALAGGPRDTLESRFFPASSDAQLEVIRWIKDRLERPQTKRAFLVDPYLGTDALGRIVLRQGNESLELMIMVSPGGVDPDADGMDAHTDGNYVDRLIAAANRVSDALCGDIRIVHVRRGSGAKQAFHDRYLGLLERGGRIRVFLLSNSLSKAAGDWPFAVAELDTRTAWSVAAYVAALESCVDGDRDLTAETVWHSRDARPVAPAPPRPDELLGRAALQIYFDLNELDTRGRLEDAGAVTPLLDTLLAELPSPKQPCEFAEALISLMHGRDHIAIAVAERLRERPEYLKAADVAADRVADALLDRLAPLGPPPESNLEPEALLRLAAVALTRRKRVTDLVRDRFNPATDRYARLLATGRAGESRHALLLSGIRLVTIALHIAMDGIHLPERFRTGIATDQVGLLGRLLRSMTARSLFGDRQHLAGSRINEAKEALRLVARAGHDVVLGPCVRPNLGRLRSDPLIPALLRAGPELAHPCGGTGTPTNGSRLAPPSA